MLTFCFFSLWKGVFFFFLLPNFARGFHWMIPNSPVCAIPGCKAFCRSWHASLKVTSHSFFLTICLLFWFSVASSWPWAGAVIRKESSPVPDSVSLRWEKKITFDIQDAATPWISMIALIFPNFAFLTDTLLLLSMLTPVAPLPLLTLVA